jgi:hypothetical protein
MRIATLYAVDETEGELTHTARALKRCIDAYKKMYAERRRKGDSETGAHMDARVAYKLVMPTMETVEDIRAYIACVAQALNWEVISGREGSQMLYAAQVALTLAKQKSPKKQARLKLEAMAS